MYKQSIGDKRSLDKLIGELAEGERAIQELDNKSLQLSAKVQL
jgi:hypothetical protein